MTWIHKRAPSEPEVGQAMREAMKNYPPEYAPARRHERKLPEAIMNDSIVGAHSLMPNALRHVFAGYGAMLEPELPLTRRDHEMIALVVSALNDCYY